MIIQITCTKRSNKMSVIKRTEIFFAVFIHGIKPLLGFKK